MIGIRGGTPMTTKGPRRLTMAGKSCDIPPLRHPIGRGWEKKNCGSIGPTVTAFLDARKNQAETLRGQGGGRGGGRQRPTRGGEKTNHWWGGVGERRTGDKSREDPSGEDWENPEEKGPTRSGGKGDSKDCTSKNTEEGYQEGNKTGKKKENSSGNKKRRRKLR